MFKKMLSAFSISAVALRFSLRKVLAIKCVKPQRLQREHQEFSKRRKQSFLTLHKVKQMRCYDQRVNRVVSEAQRCREATIHSYSQRWTKDSSAECWCSASCRICAYCIKRSAIRPSDQVGWRKRCQFRSSKTELGEAQSQVDHQAQS